MRLLGALVLLALAALMLIGSVSEAMRARPVSPHIEKPAPPSKPIVIPWRRRALACEPPLAAHELETCA